MTKPLSERLTAARAVVDSACHLLLAPTPQQLDRTAQLLAAAVAEVRAGLDEAAHLAEPPEPLRAEARRLQKSIGRMRCLLEAAAAFHTNWARILGALCAGYTDRGEAAALERGCRFCAQG